MLEPKRFLHASLAVSDLDGARQFYGGVLGFPEVERPAFSRPGVWYQIGEIQIHMVIGRPRAQPVARDAFPPGEPHVALWVEDPVDARRELETHGLAVREVTDSPDGRHHVFVKDPDGNLVEFVGPLTSERNR